MTHDQRVTDLLNANNAELERRRAVERELAATRALLEAAGRDLAKSRFDALRYGADAAKWWNLRERIPDGYTFTPAYRKGNHIVVIGHPKEDDESHNCDAMGCGTLDHVLAIVHLGASGPNDPLRLRIDAETKPLHVEIERLRAALSKARITVEGFGAWLDRWALCPWRQSPSQVYGAWDRVREEGIHTEEIDAVLGVAAPAQQPSEHDGSGE